jgi:hypothetical protein
MISGRTKCAAREKIKWYEQVAKKNATEGVISILNCEIITPKDTEATSGTRENDQARS